MRYNLASLDEKHNVLNILRRSSKIIIRFLVKITKMLTNHALNVCAYGRKPENVGKFGENFRYFSKIFLRKWQNALFLQDLSKN